MNQNYPNPETVFLTWDWSDIAAQFDQLANFPLNEHNLDGWLAEWTLWHNLLEETHNRSYVATTRNTEDMAAREKYHRYLQEIFPQFEQSEQRLKEHLLKSGLRKKNLERPLENLQTEANLFCKENIPLLSQEKSLINKYDEIISKQTVLWKGREIPLPQVQTILQSADRAERETAWRLASTRQLQDREEINSLWREFFDIRQRLAANKGFSDYRRYRWQQLLRLDYSADDCFRFHKSIERVVVPAAMRIVENRKKQMGLNTFRPWDSQADPLGRPRLRPCKDSSELREGCKRIIAQMHPMLGEYYVTLCEKDLLDLDNRKAKAPGGYCIEFPHAKIPFIFMNAVGIHDDVLTLVHESGHAFHAFQQFKLPYHLQYARNLEFMEVASTTMEYLAGQYLEREKGGFYSRADASRAIKERLESVILFLPYIAVVDAFQHWVYENPEVAQNPAACDVAWASLWQRFMVHEDWSGLDEEMKSGWQRKLHIHEDPFYYIEYGLAELGAIQIWMQALEDQKEALQKYLYALSLGSTVGVRQLYQAAGVELIWDEKPLANIIQFIEEKIDTLQGGWEK
ncbi:MAG: M3 family oligoendopeptidase [Anaerolineales bacterium]